MQNVMEQPTTVPELMQFVQGTLQNMQEKFQSVEDSIVKRMNETGKKLDEIEKGLTDLMDHSGMGEPYEEESESEKDFSDADKGR
ncbi:Heat shock factor-binding protein 1 [Acropora cervicornis]|uniref:Heat shock factor-binding protein 1 n=2 Tax=Acropora TaxID=6127 RepID=A0AAD9QX04_ACRCE|nr:Heat shock factor-binding protein 1 [Acropora cervicornis]